MCITYFPRKVRKQEESQEIVVKVLPFFVSRSSFPVVTCSSLPVVTWSSVFGSCSHSVFGICSQSMFFLVNVLPGIGPGIGFFRVVRIVGCSLVPGSSRVSFRYCSGQLSRVPRIGYWSVSCFPVVGSQQFLYCLLAVPVLAVSSSCIGCLLFPPGQLLCSR